MTAASLTDARFLDALLNAGASAHGQDDRGETAVSCAAAIGDIARFKTLLNHGAEPIQKPELWKLALERAIAAGNADAVKYFLEQDSDLTAGLGHQSTDDVARPRAA